MLGTIPLATAALASVRVDQCVMCNPMPAGSQQASCSICTRTKGGNAPRPTRPRSIIDDVDPTLFVAPTQTPHARTGHLDTPGKRFDARAFFLHREKNSCASDDALFDSTVLHNRSQFLPIGTRQADPARDTASHQIRSREKWLRANSSLATAA